MNARYKRFFLLILSIICFFILLLIANILSIEKKEEYINISNTQFQDFLEQELVEKIDKTDSDSYNIYLFGEPYIYELKDTNNMDMETISSQKNIIYTSSYTTPAPEKGFNPTMKYILIFIAVVLLIVFVIYLYVKQTEAFDKEAPKETTRNRRRPRNSNTVPQADEKSSDNKFLFEDLTNSITFENIAGVTGAKESLLEIIDFFHNPEGYKDIGAKLPKGALLIGPPGCGKTMLAKATATEAGVKFISVSASSLMDGRKNSGVLKIQEIFATAKKFSPCIIFIDEIDSIGRSRELVINENTNEEREQTLNQLLTEMDGFYSSEGIVVLAATNRYNILDEALLRPGRFDRKIVIDRPNYQERLDILDLYSDTIKIDDSVDLKSIAHMTSGCVGADLANIINEAAIMAVKHKQEYVTHQDLLEAIEILFVGPEKHNKILSEREKLIVAVHEIGHAIITQIFDKDNPIQKITIIPRMAGLFGYTVQTSNGDKYITSKEDILAQIKILLAGRCAEEIVLKEVTSGASNDIQKATALAHEMVAKYGMSETLGLVNVNSGDNEFVVSETIATKIDFEVKNIITNCYNEISEIIKNNVDLINSVSQILVDEEVMYGDNFDRLFKKHYKPLSKKTSNNTSKTNKSSQTETQSVDKKSDNKQSSKETQNIEEKTQTNSPIKEQKPQVEQKNQPQEQNEQVKQVVEKPKPEAVADNQNNTSNNTKQPSSEDVSVEDFFNKKSKRTKKTSRKPKDTDDTPKESSQHTNSNIEEISTAKINATELSEEDY